VSPLNAGHRVVQRSQFWASARFHEPVLVLESDDWGLRRRPVADLVAPYGRPSGWADEWSETAEDVTRLLEVLAGHRDPDGRPAAMTMNLVTANADFEAIEADNFARYHDRPLDETADPAVLAGLRRGVDEGLAALELHGRCHLDVEAWLADLRTDHPGARDLFAARVDGGLSLVSGRTWRYHSELLAWADGRARPTEDLVEWLRPAVATVERIAGTPPRSVIAPHYVLTRQAEAAFAALGLVSAQGTERVPRPGRDPARSYLGQRGPAGLVRLIRTARFDPRPDRPDHQLDTATAVIDRCFEQGLPAVVDTHRINYTGPWAADARRQLDELLTAADRAGARYLTSRELAAVVAGTEAPDRTGRILAFTPRGRVVRALNRPLWRAA